MTDVNEITNVNPQLFTNIVRMRDLVKQQVERGNKIRYYAGGFVPPPPPTGPGFYYSFLFY